ncbi:hypothetical protein [Hydrogenophaga sp. 2FB]|uniref:hypothetical protein n=1 Tax=Hydrogenophaga sp. 2FB TaxID=2502187 RepID=UPI0010F8501B|nr:hypothetical protein [Hydrogenophaga sp. 2FB]
MSYANQHKTRALKFSALAAVMLAAGCSSNHALVKKEIDSRERAATAMQEPRQLVANSRVVEIRGARTPVMHLSNAKGSEWLKRQRVAINVRSPITLAAVVESLAAQGVNVSSELKLNAYSFVGRINETDAETALKIILGSTGLDFVVDDVRKVVVVRPMSSRTWYLNIGNRKSNFTSEAEKGSVLSQNNNTDPLGNQNSNGSGGGNSYNGMQGNQSDTKVAGAGAGVSTQDDFWSSLSKEFESRLSVLVPREMVAATAPSGAANMTVPPLPGAMGIPQVAPMVPPQASNMAAPSVSGGSPGVNAPEDENGFVKRQVGSFSVNPETGSVTVQAPTWILNDLDVYIKRVQEMYNTDITFSGEVILVTTNREDSEGVDLNAFAQFASGKFGFVVQNNALGGLTLSTAAGALAALTAPNQPVGGALVGMQYNNGKNALQIFNAFLSEQGNVSVVQRPLITTTSGVPGVFSKKFTDYYNTISQEAVAGSTGAPVTATRNNLIPVDFGTELRINPRIDVSTGLIRAQLTLNQALQSGSKTIQQTITAGTSSVNVPTVIPIVTRQNLSGEILLRDGDLVVVGGQSEDSGNTNVNGLPGQNGPIGAGIFGVKQSAQTKQTYYFALRVSVNKRK